MRALPLMAVFVIFILLANVAKSSDGDLSEKLYEYVLPEVEDIPVPSWFLEVKNNTPSRSYGFDDLSEEYYATFGVWKTNQGEVECLDAGYSYYIYSQMFHIGISINVGNRTWGDVLTTEYSFLWNKEYFTTGNGSKKYNIYEMDDEHFIVYRDAEETISGQYVYGVNCEAYYFSKIGNFGALIGFDATLCTTFDWLNWSREYAISPYTFMADDEKCLKFLKNYFDSYSKEAFDKISYLLEEYSPREVTILCEYDFDENGNAKVVGWGNVLDPHPYPFYNISVEVNGETYYPYVYFYTGKVKMDELFNTSFMLFDGETFTIKLKITTDDSDYEERCKTDELLPMEAKIKCYVEVDDMDRITKVTIEEARNCWIDVGNGWEVLYENGKWKEVDGTNGFKIKVRSVPAWEKLIKYSIYKFLNESNFYKIVNRASNFNFAKINDIPIYYGMGSNAQYDSDKDVVNLQFLPGNTYMYNSNAFETIFHEFGHAIKWHVYRYSDDDVEDYLGGGHGSTCDETNVYFAFEEGHSEFFASLMVDYVKEQNLIEDAFLTPTDYYTTSCHFGKHGDKVEGAVAGLLLNGLYLYHTKYEYKDNPQVKAYEIFAKASELCNKYLKHYPYTIHDVLPFIIAVEPASEESLSYYDIIEGYQCGIAQHGNANPMKTDGLYGYPLLIAVEPAWFTEVKASVKGTSYTIEEPEYGATLDDVSDGMAFVIFIDKNTKIEADFSKGGGVYIILYDLNGNPMEEIVSMQYGWGGDAVIEIEKDGIKVVQGRMVVKSNAGITYKAGDKIKITPHSEFVLDVENETATIYVIEGLIEAANEFMTKEIENGYRAIISDESIDITKYKSEELNEIWENFEEAMNTLGIEKGEENGGKQPGFELIGVAIAIAIIISIMRKRNSMQ